MNLNDFRKKKEPAVRSEASKESLEDQMQEVAAARTVTQQVQQTARWVEPEAVQHAANVEQAVKAQEDAKRDLDVARLLCERGSLTRFVTEQMPSSEPSKGKTTRHVFGKAVFIRWVMTEG